ncbi:MAG TPA: DUF664 domain-containing protein, partial [Anaerolineales bacterium]|nr:DUF664 domain-containing protein [Anaerolineales bacterium]
LNSLQELHDDIRAALKDLPQEALDWMPGLEINSLGVLVVHLTGAERYWIGDVIAGAASGRDREAEFRTKGASQRELLERLDANEVFFRTALEPLALPDLEQPRISPRNGCTVTVAWALCHVLKHTALHLGHIQLTRQLWDRRNSGGLA